MKLVDTMDKILRATFFESSDEISNSVLQTVKEAVISIDERMKSLAEEMENVQKRHDIAVGESEQLREFIYNECHTALEDFIAELFSLRVVDQEVRYLT